MMYENIGKKEKPHHIYVMYLYVNIIGCTRMFHPLHRSIHYVNTTKKIKKQPLILQFVLRNYLWMKTPTYFEGTKKSSAPFQEILITVRVCCN